MKVGPVSEWVIDYKENNERPIVVFAHHKNVVTPLLSIFKLKGLRADTITGEVKSERRSDIVDEFDVLVCSTLAAKEGLTLTAADTVVFVEREWVPGWEEQAEDRVNRIGQDAKTVHALYFTVEGTIDEKFNHLIEQKRAVVRDFAQWNHTCSTAGHGGCRRDRREYSQHERKVRREVIVAERCSSESREIAIHI
jgi:superfamily II DNA/RNA helicase